MATAEEMAARLKERTERATEEARDVETVLVSFRDGSYKKVRHVGWKHSQWIHFTLEDGSQVACNPDNVNYLHIGCRS